jgi:atypical dual specificity phosphatase
MRNLQLYRLWNDVRTAITLLSIYLLISTRYISVFMMRRLTTSSSSPSKKTRSTRPLTTSESDHRIVQNILQHSTRSQPRPRPIPNSYWATPYLLACEYPFTPMVTDPARQKLDNLLNAGVRTFIDLTEEGELFPYTAHLFARVEELDIDPEEIEYHRFPIRDRSLPESVGHMYRVLDVLKDNESRGRISAVHCRGGIGRTGMVIGCWLVQSGLAKTGEDALETIAVKWRTVEKYHRFPNSPETGPQFEFVRTFAPSPCF